MKVNLTEELKRKRKDANKEADNLVEEVKLLMDSGSQKENEALRIAGLDHQIKLVERSKSIAIERENFEKEYGNLTFTKQEIKEICIKYDLRMLESKYFKAALDTEVGYKLKNFIENNSGMGHSDDSFYIIAPENCFDLEGRPAKPFLTIDPIIVYKTPGQDNYVYIHKWGKDFTIMRRLRGMVFESHKSMYSTLTLAWSMVISLVFALSFDGFTGEWEQMLNIFWIVGVSFGLSFFTFAIMFADAEVFSQRTSEYVWNSRKKRRL